MTPSAGHERWGSPLDGANPDRDPVIGTPEIDTGTWDGGQSFDNTLSIRCQEFIIEQFTGQEIDELSLVQQAQEMGWYDPGDGTPENPGGTSPENRGNLLDLYGIPVQQYGNATPFHLANELAQGHKVIIGVDSGELVGRDQPILEEIAGYADTDGPDHAVVVSGIDTTDPDNPQVVVSDPGTGEAEARYPLDQFLAAWQNSEFSMTATGVPAPPTMPEMANFDYEAGHVPEVMGMPFGDLNHTDVTAQIDVMVSTELAQTDQPVDASSQVLYTSTPLPAIPQYDPNIPTDLGDGVITREEAEEIAIQNSNAYDDHLDHRPDRQQELYEPEADG